MDKEKFLSKIRERFQTASEYWAENFRRYDDSLCFLEGTSGHWSEEEKAKRERRKQACLTMKVVNKYAKKLVGEIRLNKIKINVSPGNKDADFQVAQALKGKVKDVEYKSCAEGIYDYVSTQTVEGGLGAWRVLQKESDHDPFEYDVKLERIENPTAVLFDPSAQQENFEDADYCFITTVMSKDNFKREFPGAEYPIGELDNATSLWLSDDEVVITEYYYKEYYDEKLVKLSYGSVTKNMEKSRAEEHIEQLKIKASQPDFDELGNPVFPEVDIPEIVKEKTVEKYRVKWAKVTGTDILDGWYEKEDGSQGTVEVPCDYIPVILNTGEMRNIKNVKYYRGLIWDGMDAARMSDYWYTAAAEMVALAPKAKYMLTPKEAEGFEDQFASNDNDPYFLFNPDYQLGRPRLEQPQTPPTAILSQLAQTEENVKGSIGMYDTDLGDQGREMSGVAINARQTPSQVSNFIYYDNLTKSVAYSGKIVVSMITKVIDTDRDIENRNEDDSQNFMPVNTTVGSAMEKFQSDPEKYAGVDPEKLQETFNQSGPDADYNNLSKGKYNVYVSTGPAFQTQRIEAASRFIELMQIAINAQNQTGLITLYYAAKNMDIDGADEYADAIRKMLPYGLLKPKPGEKPPAPPQPSPQEQMQSEILMMERRNQEAKSKVEEQRLKTEALKQERLMLDSQIDLEKARLESGKVAIENQTKIAKMNADMQKTYREGSQ